MKPWHGIAVIGMGVLLRSILQIGEAISKGGFDRFDRETESISTYLMIGGSIVFFIASVFQPSLNEPKGK